MPPCDHTICSAIQNDVLLTITGSCPPSQSVVVSKALMDYLNYATGTSVHRNVKYEIDTVVTISLPGHNYETLDLVIMAFPGQAPPTQVQTLGGLGGYKP